ncbi:MAG: hypothetical protein AB7V32_08740, partial [Candidatus Berkiella sp.]
MKVLFFAPHAGIWPHAFPEALIAESLAKEGNEIVYITCEKSFNSFCTVMAAHGLTNNSTTIQKEDVCNKCSINNNLLLKQFPFRYHSLKTYIDNSNYQEIEEKLSKINRENLIDFTLDEVEIGRLTLYQILLEYKKNTLNFSDQEWQRVLVDLRNALITFYAAKKFFLEEKPDAVIVYNPLYS